MASYYDSYDSRPRPSRRDEPSTKSRTESHLKPTAGPYPTSPSVQGRARGGVHTDGQNDHDYNHATRRSSRQSYDPRYHYPPPLPPDTGRPPRHPPSPNRKRYTWPPLPTCEDEATALAKEAGTQKLLQDTCKDEASSRGTIDQEPLLQDVPEFMHRDERRFVRVSDSSREKTTSHLPTPPSSEDERARKASRRPSKLDMSFKKVDDNVPEIAKRAASPYAFRPSRQPKNDASGDRLLFARNHA